MTDSGKKRRYSRLLKTLNSSPQRMFWIENISDRTGKRFSKIGTVVVFLIRDKRERYRPFPAPFLIFLVILGVSLRETQF